MSQWTEHDLYRLAEWGYGCYQQGDLTRARILFAAVLEVRPADSYAARGLAGVALQEGNPAEAIQLMARIVQKSPRNFPSRLRLIEALIAAGQVAEAQREIALIRAEIPEPDLLRLELRLRHATPLQATFSSPDPITSA